MTDKMEKERSAVNGANRMPIDPNLTPAVKNPEVEELLAAYNQEKTGEAFGRLVEALRSARLLLPATYNKNGQPAPCLVTTPEGDKLFSAYTCMERIPSISKNPAVINMAFVEICRMTARAADQIAGLLINPFTDNLVFRSSLLEQLAETEKDGGEGSRTAEPYVVYERGRFEFSFLPNRFFAHKKSLIDELCADKEECIDRLFEESYEQKRMYPYLPEDFSVIAMNISDDLLLVRVDLPNKDIKETSCWRVYLAWNEMSGVGRYFTIERSKEKGVRRLGEITGDGGHTDHGEAPMEGAELSRIIEIVKEEEL